MVVWRDKHERGIMADLKLIENELVPVYETSTGEKVVYGSELHEVLIVKSRFNDWVKNRLNDCEAVENEDYESLTKNLVNGGQCKEYIIQLDTAKEMAMLERNQIGKQVRKYFIRIEKKYKDHLYDNLSVEMRAAIAIDKRVTQVNTRLDIVDKDLQEFKQDLPLLGVEESRITSMVKRKGVQCLGGKESAAYKDVSTRSRVYCDVYSQLKREFGVETYKAIKRSQCGQAIEVIGAYELPIVLENLIQDLNSQMDMDLLRG